MALYRFYVDVHYRGEVELELDDDQEAISLADNDPDEIAVEVVEQGALPDGEVEFIQRFNEDTKRWEDVVED